MCPFTKGSFNLNRMNRVLLKNRVYCSVFQKYPVHAVYLESALSKWAQKKMKIEQICQNFALNAGQQILICLQNEDTK